MFITLNSNRYKIEVAIVLTSFSSHRVQEEQADPSHDLQVVAATSVDLVIVVQAAQGCWGTLRRLVSCQTPKRCNILGNGKDSVKPKS